MVNYLSLATQMKTYILLLETSTKICSVAISLNGKVLQLLETDDSNYEHTEKLFPFIKQVVENAEITLNDLSAVAISKGPGSYTGLRIASSAAKGICYGLNIPMIGVSTLESMANGMRLNYENNQLFCPMLDARRMEVYTAVYDKDGSMKSPVEAIIIDEHFCFDFLKNHKIIFFGSGSEKAKEILKQNKNAIFYDGFKMSAKHMASLAQQSFDTNKFENLAYFEPDYLKEFIRVIKKIS